MNAPVPRPSPGHWTVAGFFVLLTFLWCGPILTDPAHVAGDVGDPLHMAWVMAWVGHQLLRNPLELFQSNNFFPYKNSLAFGDHLLPEALVGLPINLATGNAILALNVVTGLGLLTSALAGYVLGAKVLGNRNAGLIIGTALVFNSFIQGELLRINVFQLQGWCLALWMLWRFTEDPSWRNSILFSAALAFEGLTGTYYAVYTALLAPGFVAAAYVARRRWPTIRAAARLAIPALIVGALGFLFLSPYRASASQALSQKPIPDGADIASFFLPGRDLWLLGGLLPSAPRGESNHFLGYTVLALAFVGVVGLIRTAKAVDGGPKFLALVALVLIGVGGLISAGAYPRFMGASLGTSPYLYVLQSVPTLRGMATVERAAVLIQFGVALLAGIGALTLIGSRGPAIAMVVAGLCAGEQWTKPGPGFRVPTGRELPEVYRWLARDSGAVADLPVFPDRLLRFRALYPYFSTYNWRPVPIGRASFYPPAHDYFATLLQGFPDDLSTAALREVGIRDIVVHPLMWKERRGSRLRAIEGATDDFALLQAFPGEGIGAARDLDLGDERVYRVLKETTTSSLLCRPAQEIDRANVDLHASAGDGLEKMRDGDLDTAWSTVNPQKEGDFLEARWSAPQSLSAVKLNLGPRTSHFPTVLRIEVLGEGDQWTEVTPLQPVESAMETLRQLLGSDPLASITIRVPLTQARAVRLRVGADVSRPGWNPWSVAEIHFFSECQGGGLP